MISSETINNYLTRLASREPTPGGGAAAALHAAQGAALVAMVARYTTGAKYEQHAALVSRIIAAADELVDEALRLAEADELAFQGVIDSYKLPSFTQRRPRHNWSRSQEPSSNWPRNCSTSQMPT